MSRFRNSANAQLRRHPVVLFLLGLALGMFLSIILSSLRQPRRRVSEEADQLVLSVRSDSVQPTPVEPVSAPAPVPSVGSEQILNTTSTSSPSSQAVAASEDVPEEDHPKWFRKAWSKSAAVGRTDFVGDEPLIPRCKDSSPAKDDFFKPLKPPADIIPTSKNPCWYTNKQNKSGLRCMPFFYLAGVAKCGTTDLYKRMKYHPDLLSGSKKEYHWWDWLRYGDTVAADQMTFDEYLQAITADNLGVLEKEMVEKGSTNKIFGDASPSYFFHPIMWNKLDGNQGCSEPRYTITSHIHHLNPKAKMILTFRHPTARLYSRFLSRVPRITFFKGAGPKDFHRYAKDAVKTYTECFAKRSIRQCVYNGTLYKDVRTRLMEGMYPTFMADWLRVWPREQLHIMRYEDYGGHEEERVAEIFDFLGMAPLNKTTLEKMSDHRVVNSGSEEYKTIGAMLPETKRLLDDFYQPFINQFAHILNDKRFLWLDTEH